MLATVNNVQSIKSQHAYTIIYVVGVVHCDLKECFFSKTTGDIVSLLLNF